ncbi:jg16520 [Pararge aegeria aegeria]|uniref:Jg16520 protein n=1 Tax=Pararge aegeria aegeria TaxID=348720 RepID=A0A8S4SKF7_9NEOP|nr:jg16520 [Pararge aegeria aegeria]
MIVSERTSDGLMVRLHQNVNIAEETGRTSRQHTSKSERRWKRSFSYRSGSSIACVEGGSLPLRNCTGQEAGRQARLIPLREAKAVVLTAPILLFNSPRRRDIRISNCSIRTSSHITTSNRAVQGRNRS